ncbi:Protein STICHEL-like 3 [Ananas comosus]|uniref:Protein STICHEL-like 3 n=1 Tax=Ananas comosus TaxID=4615 RepID=A0A199VNC5_ANACO|nr:Protein STICHEL-like 3 [Ananas comosus]
MTKAVRRDRADDDSGVGGGGGGVGDHLRSHVHLTNCIHLKNHMHRHSPNPAERSLMRDLVALQRSRSLRDPSTSPPSWLSPSAASAAARRRARDGAAQSGRRSVGTDGRRAEIGRLSTSSPRFPSAKVAAEEASSDRVADESGDASRRSRKSTHSHKVGLRTLLEKMEEAPDQTGDGREPMGRTRPNGLSRGKKRRFKGVRRDRALIDHRGGAMFQRCSVGDGKEEDAEVSQVSRNVCGIPWNWSRIHHRGKSFLDLAGRSLSCGLSDSRGRKSEGTALQSQGNGVNLPIAPDNLTSSTSSDSEALPLLVQASETRNGSGNPYLAQDYSGELGIYSNNSLGYEEDSDLASEARSGNNRQKVKGHRRGRHRSLTQKYMPKTFKDLVGQNLVVQALSNAVLRKKVGLVYVFYGPHGTGKTSCARVFAKALNCEAVEHPKPCDVCSSCISFNLGKSRNVMEVGPIGNFDFESIMDILDNVMLSPLSSHYKVFIIDDCDTLPPDAWSVISKVVDRAPRHVVFVLISSNLDLPHIIISRCQKFFFPKLKETDIINTLQWISTSEGLEVDKDALKLIASRSDGSLRDAEMTLDQLSLLGQRISLSLVQELVGLVPDEKLVDLLDLALSADTVNTVKSLREIMESGVEPLALMSQLATIITDILAGSYVFTRERLRRKFFRRPTLSKEDMEKLRQALKTLSEAEKQLRVSNDKLTWLTAALLQLAPDQQYMLPSSSADTSLNQSPLTLPNHSARDVPKNSNNDNHDLMHRSNKMPSSHFSGKRHGEHTPDSLMLSTRRTRASERYSHGKGHTDDEKIWQAVLGYIQSDTLKQFLAQEGKLSSVSLGEAPTVRLVFSSHTSKTKAEKFRGQVLQAFESVLSSPVILEIRYESKKPIRADDQEPSENGSSQMTLKRSLTNHRSLYTGQDNLNRRNIVKGVGSSQGRWLQSDPHILIEGEIIETGPFCQEHEYNGLINSRTGGKDKNKACASVEEASTSQGQENIVPSSERMESEGKHRRKSLVRGKVSLARVINQAEGCSQRGGWSRRKAISIAEKLEQENLRLEPRSRTIEATNEAAETALAFEICLLWKMLVYTISKMNW